MAAATAASAAAAATAAVNDGFKVPEPTPGEDSEDSEDEGDDEDLDFEEAAATATVEEAAAMATVAGYRDPMVMVTRASTKACACKPPAQCGFGKPCFKCNNIIDGCKAFFGSYQTKPPCNFLCYKCCPYSCGVCRRMSTTKPVKGEKKFWAGKGLTAEERKKHKAEMRCVLCALKEEAAEDEDEEEHDWEELTYVNLVHKAEERKELEYMVCVAVEWEGGTISEVRADGIFPHSKVEKFVNDQLKTTWVAQDNEFLISTISDGIKDFNKDFSPCHAMTFKDDLCKKKGLFAKYPTFCKAFTEAVEERDRLVAAGWRMKGDPRSGKQEKQLPLAPPALEPLRDEKTAPPAISSSSSSGQTQPGTRKRRGDPAAAVPQAKVHKPEQQPATPVYESLSDEEDEFGIVFVPATEERPRSEGQSGAPPLEAKQPAEKEEAHVAPALPGSAIFAAVRASVAPTTVPMLWEVWLLNNIKKLGLKGGRVYENIDRDFYKLAKCVPASLRPVYVERGALDEIDFPQLEYECERCSTMTSNTLQSLIITAHRTEHHTKACPFMGLKESSQLMCTGCMRACLCQQADVTAFKGKEDAEVYEKAAQLLEMAACDEEVQFKFDYELAGPLERGDAAAYVHAIAELWPERKKMYERIRKRVRQLATIQAIIRDRRIRTSLPLAAPEPGGPICTMRWAVRMQREYKELEFKTVKGTQPSSIVKLQQCLRDHAPDFDAADMPDDVKEGDIHISKDGELSCRACKRVLVAGDVTTTPRLGWYGFTEDQEGTGAHFFTRDFRPHIYPAEFENMKLLQCPPWSASLTTNGIRYEATERDTRNIIMKDITSDATRVLWPLFAVAMRNKNVAVTGVMHKNTVITVNKVPQADIVLARLPAFHDNKEVEWHGLFIRGPDKRKAKGPGVQIWLVVNLSEVRFTEAAKDSDFEQRVKGRDFLHHDTVLVTKHLTDLFCKDSHFCEIDIPIGGRGNEGAMTMHMAHVVAQIYTQRKEPTMRRVDQFSHFSRLVEELRYMQQTVFQAIHYTINPLGLNGQLKTIDKFLRADAPLRNSIGGNKLYKFPKTSTAGYYQIEVAQIVNGDGLLFGQLIV
jgi:hypothetical protein